MPPQRHNVSEKDRIPSGHQREILVVLEKFQLSSYYGLGCGPTTEIETN